MSINNIIKGNYSFSGHESFPCKSLWLKKGYDFVVARNDFNRPEAVVSNLGAKGQVPAITVI